MKTYTIQPLVWTEHRSTHHEEGVYLIADSVFGSFTIERERYGPFQWGYYFDEYCDEVKHSCDSVDEGKQQAEAYYLSRLIPALDEVPGA